MTADPFTTANSYFDEMPHHLADYCEHAGVGKACRRCRRKFDASAQWARAHLATQEPTDAEVLAALNAFSHCPSGRDYYGLSHPWADDMRAALRAVRAARRDAAREALDGLAAHADYLADVANEDDVHYGFVQVIESAVTYRDTHYPEETP